MQQSEDIVIYDIDDQKSTNQSITTSGIVETNTTTLNFDDILSKSGRMAQNSSKKSQKAPRAKQKRTNDVKIAKQEAKMIQALETELQEPERQNLIFIIQKYQSSERFGKYVRTELKVSYTSESLNKKSTSQLQAILDKIRLHLDNQNLNKIYDSALYSSTAAIEAFSKPLGVNVDGFSTMLMSNEEFKNCWERLKCETIMPTVPSHVQLCFILGQTYFLAYAINKQKEYKAPPEITALIDEVFKDDNKKTHEKTANTTKQDDVPEKPILENGMSI